MEYFVFSTALLSLRIPRYFRLNCVCVMYGYSYSYHSARGGSVIFTDKCPMKSREESVFTAWWLPMAWCLFGTKASAATMMANAVM